MSEETSNWIIIVLLSLICLFMMFAFNMVYNKWKIYKKRCESYENVLQFYAKADVFYMDAVTLEAVKCSGMAQTSLYLQRKKKPSSIKEWNHEINNDFYSSQRLQ